MFSRRLTKQKEKEDADKNIVHQCKAANVPVFVKQIPLNSRVSKKMADWPEELRVQEILGQTA